MSLKVGEELTAANEKLNYPMLLQTNSYIVPKERRAEHARLLRRFRSILIRLGCEQFEVYEQMGANWSASEATGRFVQIMRFRDRKHQRQVHSLEQTDPAAQQLINEFCELINLPYQQQQGLLAIGYYTGVPEAMPGKTRSTEGPGTLSDTSPPISASSGFGLTGGFGDSPTPVIPPFGKQSVEEDELFGEEAESTAHPESMDADESTELGINSSAEEAVPEEPAPAPSVARRPLTMPPRTVVSSRLPPTAKQPGGNGPGTNAPGATVTGASPSGSPPAPKLAIGLAPMPPGVGVAAGVTAGVVATAAGVAASLEMRQNSPTTGDRQSPAAPSIPARDASGIPLTVVDAILPPVPPTTSPIDSSGLATDESSEAELEFVDAEPAEPESSLNAPDAFDFDDILKEYQTAESPVSIPSAAHEESHEELAEGIAAASVPPEDDWLQLSEANDEASFAEGEQPAAGDTLQATDDAESAQDEHMALAEPIAPLETEAADDSHARQIGSEWDAVSLAVSAEVDQPAAESPATIVDTIAPEPHAPGLEGEVADDELSALFPPETPLEAASPESHDGVSAQALDAELSPVDALADLGDADWLNPQADTEPAIHEDLLAELEPLPHAQPSAEERLAASDELTVDHSALATPQPTNERSGDELSSEDLFAFAIAHSSPTESESPMAVEAERPAESALAPSFVAPADAIEITDEAANSLEVIESSESDDWTKAPELDDLLSIEEPVEIDPSSAAVETTHEGESWEQVEEHSFLEHGSEAIEIAADPPELIQEAIPVAEGKHSHRADPIPMTIVGTVPEFADGAPDLADPGLTEAGAGESQIAHDAESYPPVGEPSRLATDEGDLEIVFEEIPESYVEYADDEELEPACFK